MSNVRWCQQFVAACAWNQMTKSEKESEFKERKKQSDDEQRWWMAEKGEQGRQHS